jgi:FKBP-type peptidyl-prolyl cis-trans isomerase SlyD
VQIADRKVVSIEYTLKNDGGEVLDTSVGRPPLAYLHGAGNIVPGLEKALAGKSAGEEFDVTVPPEEGYGQRSDQLVRNVPLRKLPDGKAHVGMRVRADTEQGPRILTVTAVKGDYATVDANHPLAGQTLHFSVKVVEVRDASEEELSHGHVHGPGGHEH